MPSRRSSPSGYGATPSAERRARRLALQVVVLTCISMMALAITQVLLTAPHSPLESILWVVMPSWTFLMLAAPGVTYLAARFHRRRYPIGIVIVVHLGTLALVQYGLAFLGWYSHSLNQPEFAVPLPSVPELLFHTRLPMTVVFYAAMVGLTWGLQAAMERREEELRRARAEERAVSARLDALASRLRPHVLFNTLHSLGVLLERDPPRARSMVANLGAMLRDLLDEDAPALVRFDEELRLLEKYLAIERVRFGDRLTVRIDTAEAVDTVLVPRLFLQPLVENAIHHGLDGETGGTVAISATAVNGWFVVRVINDGPVVSASANHRRGVGIGTTRERLETLWPEATIDLQPRSEGGMVVEVRIPDRSPPILPG